MKSQNVSRNNTKSFKLGLFILTIGLISLLLQKGVTTVKKLVTKSTPTPVSTQFSVSQNVVVSKIIDGDTVILSTGEEVRYIGIDTPEIEDGECYSTEAARANSDLVLGKEIRVIKDTSETDKYGRLLRYIYVDDMLINDELIRQGAAKVMTVPPDIKFESTFVTSEKFAKVNKLGLWGECVY